MTAVLNHSWRMTERQLRALLRQPAWIVITLVQPLMWLLLFGSLFKKVVDIPGFHGTGSYADFLTPGVVVMTALFSGGWLGMGLLNDYERGTLDRFLTTPASRISLVAGPLVQQSIVTIVQSLIIILLGLAVGGDFAGGLPGAIVVILAAILVGSAVGALSVALALVALKEETVIATVTSFTLPLSFLSGTFMDLELAPKWVQTAADVNPFNWAVEAGREALTSSDVDWGAVGIRLGGLVIVLSLCFAVATRAFRAYQRNV